MKQLKAELSASRGTLVVVAMATLNACSPLQSRDMVLVGSMHLNFESRLLLNTWPKQTPSGWLLEHALRASCQKRCRNSSLTRESHVRLARVAEAAEAARKRSNERRSVSQKAAKIN